MCRGHSHVRVRLTNHSHSGDWCRLEMEAITPIQLEVEGGARLTLPRSSSFALWLQAMEPASSCVIAAMVEQATSARSIKIVFSSFGSMQRLRPTPGSRSSLTTTAAGTASSNDEQADDPMSNEMP